MKIKIECTLDVEPKVIKQLMRQKLLPDSSGRYVGTGGKGETVRDFVRHQVIVKGVDGLIGDLHNANLPLLVDVIKPHLWRAG